MSEPGASLVKEDIRRGGEVKRTAVLVLGLGNVLLGDDGLGAAAVVRLERDYRIPPDVCLQDGGTLGLGLLGLLSEASHVILVDAVRTESPSGSLVRLVGDDVPDAVRDRLSPHQVGVADLLAAARLIDRYPRTVTLLGLVPQAIELAIVRSAPVEAALDALVYAIVREVQSLGYTMVRQSEGPSGFGNMRDPARLFGM
jgi:hydrogenase maturation protease